MESIRILGTGSYLPPKVLTNYDLEKTGLDTTHDWIVKRTGITERRIAEADVTTSDLAHEASLKALAMAGKTIDDVDLIIVATITPDTCCPSAANWLQAKLAATRAVTFDITAACSGFIFALNVAEQYLKNKTFKNVLVVASEVMSRTLDWTDRSTCILWGDGAGAALQDRHIGVENEGLDPFAAQQRLGPRNQHHVVGAQKLFHLTSVGAPYVEGQTCSPGDALLCSATQGHPSSQRRTSACPGGILLRGMSWQSSSNSMTSAAASPVRP